MSQYTKGEIEGMKSWVLNKEPHLGKDTYILWVAGQGEIARLSTANHGNALLIAAAPDMYEALKQALRTFDARGINRTDNRYIMLEQALAKAEGKKGSKI